MCGKQSCVFCYQWNMNESLKAHIIREHTMFLRKLSPEDMSSIERPPSPLLMIDTNEKATDEGLTECDTDADENVMMPLLTPELVLPRPVAPKFNSYLYVCPFCQRDFNIKKVSIHWWFETRYKCQQWYFMRTGLGKSLKPFSNQPHTYWSL